MCIICLDIEKNKITSKDAQWALIEMANELDEEHYYEVLEKIEHLEANGQIDKIEEREQEVPVSERGKNPVEIILLKEWYVRQTHIQDRMKELIKDITFHPARNAR